MIGYAKYFDDNKVMSFKVTDKKLLNKYNKIWEKVEELLNVKFESKPIYGEDDKYIKAKIKSYQDKVNTNFQGKKTPKENSSYKCLSIITLESIIKVNKKYHPQILLDECKCEVKNKKVLNLINDDLELRSSFSIAFFFFRHLMISLFLKFFLLQVSFIFISYCSLSFSLLFS